MTNPLVKMYRRIQEKRYKGPNSVELTCGITNMYGIACPDCWHDLSTNLECQTCLATISNAFDWKSQDLSEAFSIPIKRFVVVDKPVFIP